MQDIQPGQFGPSEFDAAQAGTFGPPLANDEADATRLATPATVALSSQSINATTNPPGPKEIPQAMNSLPSSPADLYRVHQRLPTPVVALTALLAFLLISGGFALIVFSETTQYQKAQRHAATIIAQATQKVLNTAQARINATNQALNTTQSNIEATATAQASDASGSGAAAATASAISDLYIQSTSGSPAFTDPLSNNSGPGQWDVGSSGAGAGCSFANNSYHVSEAQQGKLQSCIAQSTQFSNFAYQVQVTINQSTQGQAGLLFCVNSHNNAYYFFYMTTTGAYGLTLYNNNQLSNLTQGNTSVLANSLKQANQLTVIANNGSYYLYANQQYLATVQNATISAGKVGVAVADTNTPADANFTQARVWQLQPTSISPSPTPGG